MFLQVVFQVCVKIGSVVNRDIRANLLGPLRSESWTQTSSKQTGGQQQRNVVWASEIILCGGQDRVKLRREEVSRKMDIRHCVLSEVQLSRKATLWWPQTSKKLTSTSLLLTLLAELDTLWLQTSKKLTFTLKLPTSIFAQAVFLCSR